MDEPHTMKILKVLCLASAGLAIFSPAIPVSVQAAEASTEALAKAAQNPIASMINVPIQSNIDPNWGPEDDTLAVTNIQPVLPFSLNEDWNLVTRTILPIITQPGVLADQGRETGTGDALFTGFFVPAKATEITWGVGPVVRLPTSSNERLGADEWGAGASAVALAMPGRWVIGGLISNLWGISEDDGKETNLFTLQPFINYNFDRGWYVTTSPIVTANWEASSGEKWTVPIGIGVGRIFKVGSQAMNAQAHYYYNFEKPENTGDWSIRLQLQFMFPK